MRRVALLTTVLEPGGAQHMLYSLGQQLAARGLEVSPACLYDRGYRDQFLTRFGLPTVDFALKHDVSTLRPGRADLGPSLRGWIALVRWLRALRPDVLQTYDYYANLLGTLAGRLAGVPVVVTSQRVAYHDRSRPELLLDALAARLADAVVVNSSGVRAFAESRGGIPADSIVTIPNGIDRTIATRARPREAVRSELGIAPDAPVLVAVGRLQPKKGHRLLLDTLAQLSDRHHALQLLIAGEGPCHDELAEQAARLGLTPRVHLLGLRDDVPSLLRAGDLFILPSHFEGMPNVVLEAMMIGNPVVATAIEGTTDLIEHGRHGLLVPPGDAPALAEAIDRLLSAPALARKLSGAARDRAERHFTLQAMGALYSELYERLLERTKSATGARQSLPPRPNQSPPCHPEPAKDRGPGRTRGARSPILRRLRMTGGGPEDRGCLDFYGIPVDSRSPAEVGDRVRQALLARESLAVTFVNPHSVNLARRDDTFRKSLWQFDVFGADGMGVVWPARLLSGRPVHRLSSDVLAPWLFAAARELNAGLFLIGGRPGVAERAAEFIEEHQPGVRVVGTHHGFVRDTAGAEIDQIRQSGARLVLIGMGAPRQEQWALEAAAHLPGVVLLTCGGMLDKFADPSKLEPAWTYRLNVCWLYRLAREPRRLAARYLVGIPSYLWWLARQIVSKPGVAEPVTTTTPPSEADRVDRRAA